MCENPNTRRALTTRMKMVAIIKALLKPRPMIGILSVVSAIWLGSLQGIPIYWSLPTGIWLADAMGFIYEFIAKEMSAG